MRGTNSENGYTMLAVLIITGLTALVLTNAMSRTQTSLRSIRDANEYDTMYYLAESELQYMLELNRAFSYIFGGTFSRDRLYVDFDVGTIKTGDNTGSYLSIPSRVSMSGTDDVPILTTDSDFGTQAYPTVYSLLDGSATNIVALYPSLVFGVGSNRQTIINVIPEDSSGDTGPSPSPSPSTDYDVVFRYDVGTDAGEGIHLYAWVMGDTINLFDYGLYAKTSLLMEEATCDSYDSTSADYSSSSPGCYMATSATNDNITFDSNSHIYGDGRSDFYTGVPDDFICGAIGDCTQIGDYCFGVGCAPVMLDQFSIWDTTCTANQGNYIAAGAGSLTVTGTSAAQKCWRQVYVRGSSSLTLGSTIEDTDAYWFSVLGWQATTSSVQISPTRPSETIEIYVETISGNTLNDYLFSNNTGTGNYGRPDQFHLYYLGTADLTLSGTTYPFEMALVAPFAKVIIEGGVVVKGAVIADEIEMYSGAVIHYDESMRGSGIIEDMLYEMVQMHQIYW